MCFVWNDYFGDQEFEAKTVDVNVCDDVFFESPGLREDLKVSSWRRTQKPLETNVESGKHGELVEDAVDLITINSPWLRMVCLLCTLVSLKDRGLVIELPSKET
ncbi:hypothetical protein NC651_011363 [Populus alba x Populus x berolinensis]|nr:hypothetical protein NC651_011363 [Populus alba x Populus x berolinensis]